MAKQYKTPGVYVVEQNSFGSSIVANATAIPVFIGFTEFAIDSQGEPLNKVKDSTIVDEPVLVRSMLEYQNAFGGADKTGTIYVTQKVDKDGKVVYSSENKNADGTEAYDPGLMHPSVSNFFSNGGGSCYIVSLGTYTSFSPSIATTITNEMPFIKQAIEMAETSTLILPTDLIRFGTTLYYSWGSQFANYCGEEKKYFSILDVIQADANDPVYNVGDISTYREGVSSDSPSYAGAYFPYLKSLTPYAYKSDLSNVYLDGSKLVTGAPDATRYEISAKQSDIKLFTATYVSKTLFPAVSVAAASESDNDSKIDIDSNGNTMTITPGKVNGTAADINAVWKSMEKDYLDWSLTFLVNPTAAATGVVDQLGMWKNVEANMFPFIVTANRVVGVSAKITTMTAKTAIGAGATTTVAVTATGAITITVPGTNGVGVSPSDAVSVYSEPNPTVQLAVNPAYILKTISADDTVDLPSITVTNATIEDVKTYLSSNYINMPPSPFMAGIYSRLDNATGVWTPPANVAPIGVSGPLVPLTNKQQEDLNVDASAGKSINAIRSFTGKGTLVWGARTNDGNSMDWRYVNVRRLFISMETDISMALESYVFKPNVHNTWVEVRTNIESYLFGLFQQGAFAGTVPETSYQVLIGVGETMTDEDVLNGYMRVSIMVAPVRPAEFIVLTFSQMIGQ